MRACSKKFGIDESFELEAHDRYPGPVILLTEFMIESARHLFAGILVGELCGYLLTLFGPPRLKS